MCTSHKNFPYWLILTLFLSGCLPSSCSRIEPKAISPADSLSREFAASFPVDTLQVLDRVFPGRDVLVYPRTLAYAPNGLLWITDTAQHILLTLAQDESTLVSRDTLPEAYPYLAGFRGASTFVFSPAFNRIYEMNVGGVIREIDLQSSAPSSGGLRYLTTTPSGFAFKFSGKGEEGFLGTFNMNGEQIGTIPLDGPEWRYAGHIRSDSTTVYSLSGYLPLIDTFTGSSRDSLLLVGFDSPMLARTRQFRLGDTSEPPLLSASAVLVNDLWFVLNMRPGWIQIDMYSNEGRLQNILTQPDPAFSQEFYPSDLAVFPDETGGYYISVAMIKPEPRIDRYYWHP